VTRTYRDQGLWLLALAALAAVLAIALVGPIPEPRSFRQLADERMLFGIANFWNVVSNAPFLLIGAGGLYVIARGRPGAFIEPEEKWAYVASFLAVALIAFGSAYYHLAPLDDRLMWDRLPISLGFMALLSAVIAERIDVKAGLRLLAPLLVAGVASVLHWRWSGLRGAENILPYALVQYGAIAAIVAIAAFSPSRYTRGADVLVAVAIYALAKLVEVLDAQIYALGHFVSGHTLKHLLAALAVWWLVRMLELRSPLSPPSSARPTR
jgi:hypothetical protein